MIASSMVKDSAHKLSKVPIINNYILSFVLKIFLTAF